MSRGGGSHGRVRGCPGASPGGGVAGWRAAEEGRGGEGEEADSEGVGARGAHAGAWCGLTSRSPRLSPMHGAIGPASSPASRGERKRGRRKKLPRAPRPRFGRPCALQRQVPAVQCVRAACASDSVHLLLFDIPVVQQMQKIVVVPQLQSIEGRRHSFRAAEADPRGPDCSADHGDSAVAAHFGGRCPCCAGRADSQVLPLRRPWRSHSCSAVAVHQGRSLPVVTTSLFLMVLATMETPHLRLDTVVNAPILQVVQVFIFVVALRLTPVVQTVQQTIETPQLQFVARWLMSLLRTFMCRKTAEIPQLQLIYKGLYIPVVAQWLSPMVQTVLRTNQIPHYQGVQVVDIPVVTQRLIHMVSLTREIPQLRVDMWSMPLKCRSSTRPLCATTSRRHPCRDAEAVSHGPVYFAVEFANVGGWLTSGDVALDSCAQFLAVAEDRLIPSRARSICHQLRKAGHHSVWAPACQDRIAGGHAGVGVVSVGGAPYLSHPLSLLSFRNFAGWVGF